MGLLLFMSLFSLLDHEFLEGRIVSDILSIYHSARNIEDFQSVLNGSVNEGMKEWMDKRMKEWMDG